MSLVTFLLLHIKVYCIPEWFHCWAPPWSQGTCLGCTPAGSGRTSGTSGSTTFPSACQFPRRQEARCRPQEPATTLRTPASRRSSSCSGFIFGRLARDPHFDNGGKSFGVLVQLYRVLVQMYLNCPKRYLRNYWSYLAEIWFVVNPAKAPIARKILARSAQ